MTSSSNSNNVVVHLSPAWRDKANFVIFAKLDNDGGMPKQWEQLWVRKISEDHFELCCIPFFLYDLALGDEVVTGELEEKKYVISKTVYKSGRRTVRVDFRESANRDIIDDVIAKSVEIGCEMEWYSKNLLAIDLKNDQFSILTSFLESKERLHTLKYEIGS